MVKKWRGRKEESGSEVQRDDREGWQSVDGGGAGGGGRGGEAGGGRMGEEGRPEVEGSHFLAGNMRREKKEDV